MDKYTIKLPIINDEQLTDGPIYVEKSSDKTLRNKLETFALYFQREFKYDFPQYEANEHLYNDNKYIGILFAAKAWDKVTDDIQSPYRLFGGACFRWRDGQGHNSGWVLDWIWFHPFFRHRGVLAKHWKQLKIKFGDFCVAEPLSADMKKFLSKNN